MNKYVQFHVYNYIYPLEMNAYYSINNLNGIVTFNLMNEVKTFQLPLLLTEDFKEGIEWLKKLLLGEIYEEDIFIFMDAALSFTYKKKNNSSYFTVKYDTTEIEAKICFNLENEISSIIQLLQNMEKIFLDFPIRKVKYE